VRRELIERGSGFRKEREGLDSAYNVEDGEVD
jgi:hypothetical protein